jgi:hypothetical protein
MEAGTDLIEQEAWRRAVDGYDRPVFQDGELVGLVRAYSDVLLMMLLRGRRPEAYREGTNRGTPAKSIIIRGGLAECAFKSRCAGGSRISKSSC